jgi:hypothetical protein
MLTLAALMGAITDIQNRGSEMVDPASAMAAAQTALLQGLVDAVQALQSAAPAATTVTGPSAEELQNMVAEAVSAAFGKLESAATPAAEAQPEVAQNTGSGAAPQAPASAPASESASPTPDAAGTAPQTTAPQA